MQFLGSSKSTSEAALIDLNSPNGNVIERQESTEEILTVEQGEAEEAEVQLLKGKFSLSNFTVSYQNLMFILF